MSLLASLEAFCLRNGLNKTYWIALSGGLDSHVLLDMFFQLRLSLPLSLRAIHINHHLNKNADAWTKHCKTLCETYDIPYVEREIKMELSQGDSLEEIARKKRYAVLAEYIQENDVLLTAHHQDDQAETILLQLVRGAGLKGLAAMPVIKPFAKGFHARPLLHVARAELTSYAYERKLNWIEDESNQNTQLSRNFIRHDILPLLKSRWPSVTETLSRSAMHCAEAQRLLDELTVDICESAKGSEVNTLSVNKLLQVDYARQKLILRTWIHQHKLPIPSVKKMETIVNDVLHASWDSMPCVTWEGAELRRYRDDLFVMSPLIVPEKQTFTWNFKNTLHLPHVGHLIAEPRVGKGLRCDLPEVTVRFRQEGEMVTLSKRGRLSLKNLFQEWKIPPWERPRTPLIFMGDKLLCMVGYFIDPDHQVQHNEPGFELHLKPLSLR